MKALSDYAVFSNPKFDPNEYANAVLAGEPYPSAEARSSGKTIVIGATKSSTAQDSIAKEDISVAISKLTFAIDDVSKQIKNVVSAQHENLLAQAERANGLSGSLTSVRSGLNDLDTSVDKLRHRIHTPYESLQNHVLRLQKFQQASDLLRRTSRFVILARRLQLQMNEMDSTDIFQDGPQVERDSTMLITGKVDTEDEKERTISKAALSIAELASLLNDSDKMDNLSGIKEDDDGITENYKDNNVEISLRSIHAVSAYESFVEDARSKVTLEMENMVMTGLATLNQTLLASSFQTSYNLKVLPSLVQNLSLDLSHAVEDRIRNAFDLSKISKDALAKESALNSSLSPQTYRSRVRTEPTNITAPQWSTAFWSRLETMFDEMSDCCIKVYTIEKVLKIKTDATTQITFLDEAMKLLENKPSAMFWTTVAVSLEKHSRDATKGSTFLQQTLSTGYPRLLRYFHDFFGKIGVYTDTIYTDTYQSPETVLVLRALSNVEALYLARSTQKMNEVVGNAFSSSSQVYPGLNEGVNIARVMSNELDSAKFDPLLVKAIAKNIVSCLDLMQTRVDGMAARDRSATTLLGPLATPQQISNGQLATCLYHCWCRLIKLENEYPKAVYNVIQPSLQILHRSYERLVEPLSTAICRELSAIISKVHRIDFGKFVDSSGGMGGASIYTKELTEKLNFIKNEILSKYDLGDAGRQWVASLVKFVIRTFLLHISIAKPLGESGKLQMTSDMMELEFALNAFMIFDNSQNKRGGNLETVGDEYWALRSMRPLLFLDNNQLTSKKFTSGLPPLIVLHHILVRSPVSLPHKLHGWQEAEYVRWVDEHSEEEAWTLIDGGLSHWEKVSEGDTEGREYIELARTVLQNARA